MADPRLEASDGLALVFQPDGHWRVEWGHADWLGPIGLRVRLGRDATRAGRPLEDWIGPGEAAGSSDAAPPDARALAAELRLFEGEDALGAFTGLAVEWDPAPLPVGLSVRAYRERPVLVFRIEAEAEIDGLGTGALERPSVSWPWLRPAARLADGLPEGARAYGHGYTEFGLPTHSDASLAGFGLLRNPPRPAVVEPLWLIAPDGRCLLLAPLDAFHEQVIAVPRGVERAAEGVHCGWHGDLDAVPRGFASELALWAGPGPRRVLEAWGTHLRERYETRRPGRYADAVVGRLSYWTDNGAAYWYRTEPGMDVSTTLERTAARLREDEIPCHAFELDSWFYPHATTRPVGPVVPVPGAPEAPVDVPPTGALAWEPREDILPEGMDGLRRRLGDPPLVLHARHFSSRSDYFEDGRFAAWRDGERAHPEGPELLETLCAQAAGWGAIQIEQDWLIESFLGVRGLRERPGRARAWQEGFDASAGAHGLTLHWCMASPADFFQTLTLRHVTAIRTSGDYRYLIGNRFLWTWFLYGNALARALGLHPYKDVFLSRTDGEGLSGDPHAEVEAMLSALSSGPVGIGDRLGRSDRALVLRTCRPDGVLVKPDVPLAALERCFRESPFLAPEPLLAECWSEHPAGRWVYLAALHASLREERLDFRVGLDELADAAPSEPVLAYDWRSGDFERLEPDAAIALALDPGDWALRVLCPLLAGGLALFGDVSKYASVGDRRVGAIRSLGDAAPGLAFEVWGVPGERVEIAGYCEHAPARVRVWARSGEAPGEPEGCVWEPGSGRLGLKLRLGPRGWATVELEAG